MMENPCKDLHIDELIGHLPDGTAIFASGSFIATHGKEKIREELVDTEWLRQGMDPPGYHRIRTHPFNYDYVLVYGPTHAEALEKYLRKTTNRYNKI